MLPGRFGRGLGGAVKPEERCRGVGVSGGGGGGGCC